MKIIFTVIIYLFIPLGLCNVYSQTSNFTTENKAINSNKYKQYQLAIENAKKKLSSNPESGDLIILIANNYAWQDKTDSALLYIQKAQQIKYYNNEMFDSWLNILLWSHQYNNLIEVINTAKKYHYSDNENLLRKNLIACTELKNYNEGIKLAESADNKELIKIEDISYLYNNLLMKRNTNVISAFYSLDFFDSYAPQHLASLGYSFQVDKHTLAIRSNYAKRFGSNDMQLESDFYFQLKNKSYMYFNYGYAFNSSLFPKHRIGYEYYISLKHKMETSLGARYLSYINSKVYILTGHLEKYMGRNWLAFRPFYVIQKNARSFTLLGNYRFYGKDPLNFWGIELGYGNSPDDSYANIQNATYKDLKAYKAKLEKNFVFSRISDIKIGIGYSREEFKSDKFRNRYLIELGYKFRFK
jgi:YaiO family outer membrane protein